jgi:hypothetical protein
MTTKTAFSLLTIASLAMSGVALAGGKTYQVKGKVTKVTDAAIWVQSGTQKWEIARDATTKVKGDLKAGAEVTVSYAMHATAVDAKAAAATTTTGVAAPPPPKMKSAAPAAQKKEGNEADAQKKELPQTPTPTPTPSE